MDKIYEFNYTQLNKNYYLEHIKNYIKACKEIVNKNYDTREWIL